MRGGPRAEPEAPFLPLSVGRSVCLSVFFGGMPLATGFKNFLFFFPFFFPFFYGASHPLDAVLGVLDIAVVRINVCYGGGLDGGPEPKASFNVSL